MNSLTITQTKNNGIIEGPVPNQVVTKLYNIGKDDDENQTLIVGVDTTDENRPVSTVSGRISVNSAFANELEYLAVKFPDLEINSSSIYIHFKDPEVLRILIAAGIGDGVGITQENIVSATLQNVSFNNADYFPEFELFTSMTTLQSNMGINVSNLKELSLPFTTMNAELIGIGNVEILIAKKLQTLGLCLSWELPEGLSLIYLGASQFNFNRSDDFTFITSDKNYSTVPGRFLYIPNATSITGGGDSVFGNRLWRTNWVYSIVYIKGILGISTNIGPNVFKNCIITNFVINNTTLPTISSIPNIANLYVPESILTKTGNTYQLTDSTSAWNVSGINYYPIEELDTIDTIDLWKQQSKPTKLISELM